MLDDWPEIYRSCKYRSIRHIVKFWGVASLIIALVILRGSLLQSFINRGIKCIWQWRLMLMMSMMKNLKGAIRLNRTQVASCLIQLCLMRFLERVSSSWRNNEILSDTIPLSFIWTLFLLILATFSLVASDQSRGTQAHEHASSGLCLHWCFSLW